MGSNDEATHDSSALPHLVSTSGPEGPLAAVGDRPGTPDSEGAAAGVEG